jgi:hypothetical protein
MTIKEQLEKYYIEDEETNIVLFESPNYDEAFVGLTLDDRAVYDYDKMIECLITEDNMDYEEAVEFIDYNTIRSLPYAGEKAPVVIKNPLA